jgi:elongation factor P hydroxylase
MYTNKEHRIEDIIFLFNTCFEAQYNTILVKGQGEPIYLPATAKQSHNEIHFAHGFYRSALHECAHWLIAGQARRKEVDFGYWYEPDGRSAAQQRVFEQVEVKPQAVEWILSAAAGVAFRVSVDNLDGEETDSTPFKNAVYQQVLRYIEYGLNSRAESLRLALSDFYGTNPQLSANAFEPEHI